MAGKTIENRIVVGVDGSPVSAAALRWACVQARAQGAVVHAVTAWLHDAMLDDASAGRTPSEAEGVHLDELQAFAEKVTDGHTGVEVTYAAPIGDAADMLVAESADAAMLVLGSHGTGKLRHLLMGSVCSACLRHARCPVVVLPPEVTSKSAVLERLLGSVSSYVPGPVL